MSGWRWNKKVAAVLATLVLAVNLAIPTFQLLSEKDQGQRFGWQMFSNPVPDPRFIAVIRTGDHEMIALSSVLARPRGDLPLTDLVPPHLCATRLGVLRVLWDGGSHEC